MALVLVVVLLLGALVLVVLVFVLVLMVVLGWLVLVLLVPVLLVVLLLLAMVLVVVLVVRAGGGGGAGAAGAGGGGGGSVGGMNFGTSFAPRSPTSFAPRHNCNKVRVLFYCIGLRDKYWVLLLRSARTLQSASKKWHRTLLLSAPYHADWADLMDICRLLSLVACASRVGGTKRDDKDMV